MVVVVDYGICNVRSVVKALELVGATVRVSSAPRDLEEAERIVLPGVGAFEHGMTNSRRGWRALPTRFSKAAVPRHLPGNILARTSTSSACAGARAARDGERSPSSRRG
jgi:hypothetical protein